MVSPSYRSFDDHALVEMLRHGDTQAFETLYDRYVHVLYKYIESRVRDGEESRELVQSFFEWLWTTRETLLVTSSVKSFFFGAAKHQVLNHFRSLRVKEKYIAHFSRFMADRHDQSTEEIVNVSDLENSIERSLAVLPKKVQTVFRMSRIERVPTPRIAEELNISPRTVENLISQAVKHLRASLDKAVILLILLLIQ